MSNKTETEAGIFCAGHCSLPRENLCMKFKNGIQVFLAVTVLFSVSNLISYFGFYSVYNVPPVPSEMLVLNFVLGFASFPMAVLSLFGFDQSPILIPFIIGYDICALYCIFRMFKSLLIREYIILCIIVLPASWKLTIMSYTLLSA